MATENRAEVTWKGSLMEGSGTIHDTSSGKIGNQEISWKARAEDQHQQTNPEELIAAAHAACLSMALSAGLEKAGKPATRVQTEAACTMDMVNGTPTITRMDLTVRGKVPGLDQAGFQKAAEEAKSGCPVSRALKGIPQITLDAKLD